MANTPTPKSYETILGNILATYLSKIGVNDLNPGSAVISFFEAISQAIYRASGDTFSILRDFSVDRAEGDILKFNKVTEKPLEECLLYLAYLSDKATMEHLMHRENMNKYKS